MDCYEIVKSIGSGSFGQVYMARHKREDRLFVIKRIKIRDMTQKEKENTENEVRLLQKLRHPNIVAYKDSYLDREQFLNIVMTHCEGGDIYQKIRQSKQKNFPEPLILDWMSQMALALFYLHDQKILHRDLKTQNIFLKNGRVRLGDFGIAKVLDSTRDLANTCIGTPFYMSPELFRYKPYSYKSDVWAMGCCLYEMCNLRHAFDAQSIQGLALKIMKGSYPPITSIYSKALRDLIQKMLNLNQKLRPSIWEIVNKPLVKNRIILFMLDIFNGSIINNNQLDKEIDVEDVYVESLWEQADNLQITPIINHYLKLLKQGVKFEDIQKEIEKGGKGEQKLLMQIQEQELIKKKLLKQEFLEKQKLEEEIKRLERRRTNNEEEKQVQRGKNLVSLERESKRPIPDPKLKKDRSYSLEKDTPTNQRKQQIRQPGKWKRDSSKASIEDRSNSTEKSSQFSQQSLVTQTTQKKTNDIIDAKQKVMQEKQKKVNEQKQRWEKEFQQISQQNLENRKKAQEQKFAQYRPSSGMNQVFKKDQSQISILVEPKRKDIDNSIEDNNYDMDYIDEISDGNDEEEEEDQEVNPIPEIENEDEYEEIPEMKEVVEKRLEQVKNRLKEKTLKINELQQSLMESKRFKEKQIKAFQTGKLTDNNNKINDDNSFVFDELTGEDLNYDNLEERDDFMEDEDDENQVRGRTEQNTASARMNDRMKLLRHRCEAGLGKNLFEKGYEIVRERGSSMKGEELRKLMIDLLGEENVGYWHLMDQLLCVEELYKQAQSCN